jgi:hypothetical protein
MNPELSPNYLGPDIHVRPVCSRFYGVHICVVELVTPSRMALAVPIEIMTRHGTARHGTARHGTARHGTTPHHTTPHHTTPHHTTPHHTTPHHTTPHHTTPHHTTPGCDLFFHKKNRHCIL